MRGARAAALVALAALLVRCGQGLGSVAAHEALAARRPLRRARVSACRHGSGARQCHTHSTRRAARVVIPSRGCPPTTIRHGVPQRRLLPAPPRSAPRGASSASGGLRWRADALRRLRAAAAAPQVGTLGVDGVASGVQAALSAALGTLSQARARTHAPPHASARAAPAPAPPRAAPARPHPTSRFRGAARLAWRSATAAARNAASRPCFAPRLVPPLARSRLFTPAPFCCALPPSLPQGCAWALRTARREGAIPGPHAPLLAAVRAVTTDQEELARSRTHARAFACLPACCARTRDLTAVQSPIAPVQVVLLHRFLSEAAPPGTEAAFAAALAAHARSRHAAVERALDWVIAMCAPLTWHDVACADVAGGRACG
jgi:hypothetical protein